MDYNIKYKTIQRLAHKTKAISPIIAEMILIVITIIAGSFLYSFALGYLGALASEQSSPPSVQITPVSFFKPSNDTYSGVLEVTITNSGSSTVTIDSEGSLYFSNGTLAGYALLVKAKFISSYSHASPHSSRAKRVSQIEYFTLPSLSIAPGETVEYNITLIALSPYYVEQGYTLYIEMTTTAGYTIRSISFNI